jgi:hypothetical protein
MGIAIRTRHMLERCVDGRKTTLEFAVVEAPTHSHRRTLQGPILKVVHALSSPVDGVEEMIGGGGIHALEVTQCLDTLQEFAANACAVGAQPGGGGGGGRVECGGRSGWTGVILLLL